MSAAAAALKKRQASSSIDTVQAATSSDRSRKRPRTDSPKRSTTNGSVTIPPETLQNHKITANLTNGVKGASISRVDESRTTVTAPTSEAVLISSDEESSEVSEDDDDEEGADDRDRDDSGDESGDEGKQAVSGAAKDIDQSKSAHDTVTSLTNGAGKRGGDSAEGQFSGEEDGQESQSPIDEMEDADVHPAEEPSFGELLHAHAPDEVDVDAAFERGTADSRSHSSLQALARSADTQTVSTPSANSLTVVLTQALRTNDVELLETCFRLNDVDGIRATIERLPSNLVTNLLQRIAERLYKRPGRAGNLMIWVQWSIVAHGGYLASQPDLMKKLSPLNRVLRERAASLQPLLALKGKLDMLNAQLELRRSKQAAARQAALEDEEDEDGLIYIEGEDDESEEANEANEQQTSGGKGKKRITDRDVEADAEDIDLDAGDDDGQDSSRVVDGAIADGDDEEDDSDEEDGLLDDEVLDSDVASGDELESGDGEGSESDGAASEEEVVLEPKRSLGKMVER
ncbi:MAG: Small subunit (SSU) processome component [Bogoriella megaspora]|nr:MAG: Small subunit (SSU) processome component [Bogoriella megaspora]